MVQRLPLVFLCHDKPTFENSEKTKQEKFERLNNILLVLHGINYYESIFFMNKH